MKAIKKLFVVAMAAALAGAMLSCVNPASPDDNGGKDGEPDAPVVSDDGKTYVLFKNSGPYAVDVFSDSARSSKQATVPSHDEYRLAWSPSPDGHTFYLTYLAPLGDDMVVPYKPSPPLNAVLVRVDEGKTTPISIGALASSSEPISDKAYLLLYNEGDGAALFLVNHGTTIRPEAIFSGGDRVSGDSNLVNPHERAWYILDPGSADAYHISVNGTDIQFSGLTEFLAGRFYIARNAGGGLNVDTEQELSLEALLNRRPPAGIALEALYGGGDPTVRLVWQPSFEAVSYRVYRKTGEAETFSPIGNASACLFQDTGISEGQTYAYKVGAVFEDGSESTSGEAPITIKQAYAITIGDMEHGTIQPGVSRASAGALVVLTVNPDTRYRLKTGSLKYNDGSDHPVEDESFIMPACDVTVSAEFEQVFCIVIFNADGGSPAIQERWVNSGASLGSAGHPDDVARPHYTFSGWYTERNGEGDPVFFDMVITEDIDLYAHWVAILQCTVTFDADGGLPATQTRTVNAGASLGDPNMPEVPTRTGYTFGGWYTEQNGDRTEFTKATVLDKNITVYAGWAIPYTVTYHPNEGTGTPPAAETVNANDSVILAGQGELTRQGYTFKGWNTQADGTGTPYNAGDSYTPTANSFLYAQWTSIVPDTLSLNDALGWISNNAVEGGSYPVTVKANETISPRTLSYDGKTVEIILMGDATERTVSLSANGSLFLIESGVTLILGNNLVLQGLSSNDASLVQVNSGGALVMNTSSAIRDNTFTTSLPSGGGVSVSGGTFTMNGGTISGNTASSSSVYSSSSYGGGVSVNGGTFTMNDGTISDNTSSFSSYSYGGGVSVREGTFAMNGGTISGNKASSAVYSSSSYGGGVSVDGGTFTMNDGTISGNISYASSSSYGGGVSVSGVGATFTMSNGIISDNTASSSSSPSYGGGVSVDGGIFTMSGGTISGHTTASRGGGVYVDGGTFTKQQSGGTIYGSNESDSDLKNTATDGDSYGHAVYVSSGSKKRNTTAGLYVTLDSARTISEGGGWE